VSLLHPLPAPRRVQQRLGRNRQPRLVAQGVEHAEECGEVRGGQIGDEVKVGGVIRGTTWRFIATAPTTRNRTFSSWSLLRTSS
jgi:hypothetical protein